MKTTIVLLVVAVGLAFVAGAQAAGALTARQAAQQAKACLVKANPRIKFESTDHGRGFIATWPGKANNAWGRYWGSVSYSSGGYDVVTASMPGTLNATQRHLFQRCTDKS